MEENKKTENKVEDKKNSKKLSYEELENAANQIMMQYDVLRKENTNLKEKLQQLQLNDIYTELNFRFRVIENAKAFDSNFVEYCVNSIQEIMLPVNKVESEENIEIKK